MTLQTVTGEDLPPAPSPLASDVFDSHCHLDMLTVSVYDALKAAQAVGVRLLVTIGYDLGSSVWAARCAQTYPDIYAGVAIHPNEAGGASPEALAEIERLAGWQTVRAVGETGLDYYRDWCAPEIQQESFRAHIGIAKRTGKALVIHDRDAHDDVLRILAEEGPPDKVIFHCFSGDAAMAKVCADHGYYMSFAGTVTYKNATGVREAAALAPLELMLVETDAPYLPPMPHRGKTNAPHLIPLIVRCLAEVKGVAEERLCTAIAANGEAAFGAW